MLMIQAAGEPSLTLGGVLRNLPHDAAALVVYVLVIAFVGFIWYGSRRKPGGAGGRAGPAT